MTSDVKRIGDTFEHYDEDGDQFVTYMGEPFTGILYEEYNGIMYCEESIVGGVRTGYTIGYTKGKMDTVVEREAQATVGIAAEWDAEGNFIDAQKVWEGTVIEEVRMENGSFIYEKKATDEEIHKLLTSPLTNVYNFREEPVEELMREAEYIIRITPPPEKSPWIKIILARDLDLGPEKLTSCVIVMI